MQRGSTAVSRGTCEAAQVRGASGEGDLSPSKPQAPRPVPFPLSERALCPAAARRCLSPALPATPDAGSFPEVRGGGKTPMEITPAE